MLETLIDADLVAEAIKCKAERGVTAKRDRTRFRHDYSSRPRIACIWCERPIGAEELVYMVVADVFAWDGDHAKPLCQQCFSSGQGRRKYRRWNRGERQWNSWHDLAGTMKGWCWADNALGKAERQQRQIQSKCRGCGRTLIAMNHWRSWLCSRACCMRLCRRRQKKNPTKCICSICQKTFEPKRSDARYCSHACRQRDYRTRKAVHVRTFRRAWAIPNPPAKHSSRLSTAAAGAETGGPESDGADPMHSQGRASL